MNFLVDNGVMEPMTAAAVYAALYPYAAYCAG